MLQRKKMGTVLVLAAAILLLTGCQEKKPVITDGREVYVKTKDSGKEKEDKKAAEVEEEIKEEVLFLITGINMEGKTITLRSLSNLNEEEYEYNGATYIKDKYGNSTTINQLTAGEMVYAQVKKETVKSIEISDEVFSYSDIHNFLVDQENKTITVGKNSYYYENDIMVFYKNSSISLAEVSDSDTICLKGIDKKVFAIQVEQGHGTVVLENTGNYEGGNITIGNVLSQKITSKMRIEVPEGTHLMSVAKDGYGGSKEITVEANRETAVDLNEFKGEEPKYCTIAFVVEPDNATLYLNGEVVDLSQTMQLKYGTYTVKGKADGYAQWSGKLIVNSEKANIKIELLTEEEQKKAEEKAAEIAKKQAESGKEQEDLVKKFIEELRNNTLSTSTGSTESTSTGTTGSTGTGTSSVIK